MKMQSQHILSCLCCLQSCTFLAVFCKLSCHDSQQTNKQQTRQRACVSSQQLKLIMYEAITMNEPLWLSSRMKVDSYRSRTLFQGRCVWLMTKKINLVEKCNQCAI